MHEIVAAGRRVGCRLFPDEVRARHDVLQRRHLPAIRRHSVPVPVNVFLLGAIVNAIDFHPPGAIIILGQALSEKLTTDS